MPGPVLHAGAVTTCAHGGMATPTAPSPVVLVSGNADRDHRRPRTPSQAAPSRHPPAMAPA